MVKMGPRTPDNLGRECPPLKIARKKRGRSSIAQQWIIRFRSNFVYSLNAWQNAVKIPGEEVKGKGHSVVYNVCKNSQNYQ